MGPKKFIFKLISGRGHNKGEEGEKGGDLVPTNNSNYKDLKIIFKLINGRGHNKSRVRKVVIMPPAPLGLVGR